jgi:hypothetical protein
MMPADAEVAAAATGSPGVATATWRPILDGVPPQPPALPPSAGSPAPTRRRGRMVAPSDTFTLPGR